MLLTDNNDIEISHLNNSAKSYFVEVDYGGHMASKTVFKVDGYYEVSFKKGKGKGKHISQKEASEKFWKEHPSLKNKVGCYIFAIRAGKGFTPMYVGKATISFKQEIFSSNKIVKYNDAIFGRSGTPVLFFLIHPIKKGGNNKKHISELEKHLIENGSIKNPELLNKQGKGKYEWTIEGVSKSNGGYPGKTAKQFKKMFGFY